MSNGLKRADRTVKLTYLAMMTAMVILFEMVSIISGGAFTITLSLIPIVIGAAICGIWGGAWLGGVFGATVLISGKAAAFYGLNAPGTIITVMLKGICAGLVAGLVYHLLSKVKNEFVSKNVSVVCAGIAAPIVNTAIFVLGCFVFFYAPISGEAGGGFSTTFWYVLTAYVGTNFFIEFGINLLITPVLVRLLELLNKKAFKM